MKWLDEPEGHDYTAAEDYLTLMFAPCDVEDTVYLLRDSTVTTRKAKDILRASGLAILPPSNAHVAKDARKIRDHDSLSPILLVRTPLGLQIADGYHRVCAVYHDDDDTDIPCKLVSLAGHHN